MAEIKILLIGVHDHIANKLLISSTVTLIKSNKNILVDTGGFGKGEELKQKLAEENLTVNDIDIIVLTHLHLDHLCNIHLFPNAVIYCKFIGGEYPGQKHFPKEGTLERFEFRDGTEIAKDVYVIELPGHTSDLIGLRVKTKQGTVIITGDAISTEKNAVIENKPPKIVLWSEEAYDQSRKKVLDIADYVIPGHGDLFKVKKSI